MPHCAVIWCRNQSKHVNKTNNGVTYHKFPQDPHLQDKWIRATGKCNWFPQKHDTICSEHFDVGSFKKKEFKTYLFYEAIPTLKLHPIFEEIDSLSNIDNAFALSILRYKRKKNHSTLVKLKPIDEKKTEIAPEIIIKEEVCSDIALKNRFNEGGAPDLVTTVCIKEELSSDILSEIQMLEEAPPDLATTVHIEREDPVAETEIVVEVPPIEQIKESQAPREAIYTIDINDSPETRYLKRSLKEAHETIKRQKFQVKRFRENNKRLTKKVTKMEYIVKCLQYQCANN
ncbi:hypothetical protein PYW07_009493 [Mythimna separata]|uniref:THAP-type domain-containing protein n=1 Tax=Mythimna separata TaxID=271217 RepID=A0AAD7YBM5_MYTSE|nr:hypothetical protein PYW07_009493 [Mythimna separata]